MKSLIKQALQAAAPDMATRWAASRQRKHIEQFEARLGIPRIAQDFTQKHGLVVQDGPMAGMQYISRAIGSAYLPKLCGSYEAELHSLIRELFEEPWDLMIDVGCAEGFYAVGFAIHVPTVQVHAFDIDEVARQLCTDLAQRNNVASRVHVQSACSPAALQETLSEVSGNGRALIITDCEGYEGELLDPSAASALRTATLLVEAHDLFVPGVSDLIQSRFSSTHEVRRIEVSGRNPADYPSLSFLSPADQEIAVSEFRTGENRWLFIRPHAKGNA